MIDAPDFNIAVIRKLPTREVKIESPTVPIESTSQHDAARSHALSKRFDMAADFLHRFRHASRAIRTIRRFHPEARQAF